MSRSSSRSVTVLPIIGISSSFRTIKIVTSVDIVRCRHYMPSGGVLAHLPRRCGFVDLVERGQCLVCLLLLESHSPLLVTHAHVSSTLTPRSLWVQCLPPSSRPCTPSGSNPSFVLCRSPKTSPDFYASLYFYFLSSLTLTHTRTHTARSTHIDSIHPQDLH